MNRAELKELIEREGNMLKSWNKKKEDNNE